jgi:hypothetical protein
MAVVFLLRTSRRLAWQKLDLTIHRGEHRVYDLIARRDVTDSLRGIELAPGEGGLLFAGRPTDYDADCRLIDALPQAIRRGS